MEAAQGKRAVAVRGHLAWMQGASEAAALTQARALLDVLALKDGGLALTDADRSARAAALLPELAARAAATPSDPTAPDPTRDQRALLAARDLIARLVIQEDPHGR